MHLKEAEFYNNLGVDESNNGFGFSTDNIKNFPAIYSAVFSNFPEDLATGKKMHKKRGRHKGLEKVLNKRHYTYLLLEKKDYVLIEPYKRPGLIIGSLIYQEPIEPPLTIYFDGEWDFQSIDFIKGFTHEITNLEKDLIEIKTGADLDKKIPLVNIADEAAHWLLNRPLKYLRESPNRRSLIRC